MGRQRDYKNKYTLNVYTLDDVYSLGILSFFTYHLLSLSKNIGFVSVGWKIILLDVRMSRFLPSILLTLFSLEKITVL